MVWNVYERDFNSREIKVFNIFDHYSFRESVAKLKKKKFPKEEFAKRLKLEVMYYFWTKSEYEVVASIFPVDSGVSMARYLAFSTPPSATDSGT